MIKEVYMTKQFENDLNSLDKTIQASVSNTIRQISVDHRHPGLNSKKQTSIPSRDIWRSRVDRNFRLLWEWWDSSIRLWRVGKHAVIDDIDYIRAQPKDQWRVHVRDENDHSAIEVADIIADPSQPQPFQYTPDNILRLFGVPDEHLPAIKALSDPEAIWNLPIPENVQSTLYDILLQREDWTVSDLLDDRQLLYRTTVDNLEGYCEGKIKRLMLNLDDEQQNYVSTRGQGPILIKGVAGSGKTTIGLYRAHHLAAQIEESRRMFGEHTSILLLTYTQTLTKALEQLYLELYGELPYAFKVAAIKEWMLQQLNAQGLILKSANGQRHQLIKQAQSEAAKLYPNDNIVSQRPAAYLLDEIDAVIRSRMLRTLEDYQAIERVGRGIGLDRHRHRPILWKIYELYQQQLDKRGLFDWNDLSRLVMKHCQPLPQFDVVIIDEAQDLPPCDLHLATRLIPNYSDLRSLTLLADPAQSIYYRGIPWKEGGINIQGRTRILAKNFRNTREILEAARHIVDACDDLKAEEEYVPPISVHRHGPKPIVVQYASSADSNKFLAQEIIRLCRNQNYRPGDIAIISRTKTLLTKFVKDYLNKQDIHCTFQRDDEFHILENDVKLITMHSSKGLEFPVVFLIGLSDDYMPWIERDSETRLDDELQERKLFYVSMTRAAERLYLLHPQQNRCRFLYDLHPHTIREKQA